MSTRLLDDFSIPAGQTRYVDMYLDGTDRLLLYFDVACTGGSSLTFTVTNGYGGRDPGITWPYNQPIPLVLASVGTTLSTVKWDLGSAAYSLSAPVSNRQTGSLEVAMNEVGDYIQIAITNPNGVAATVSLFGVAS